MTRWIEVESVPTRKQAMGPIAEPVDIETREGTMTAQPGDFIIKESDGHRYPIAPEKFHRFYQPVGDDAESFMTAGGL